MTTANTLQEWAEANGVKGIRFYPSNASESSASSLLDGALSAVKALDSGSVVAYEDTVTEIHSPHE